MPAAGLHSSKNRGRDSCESQNGGYLPREQHRTWESAELVGKKMSTWSATHLWLAPSVLTGERGDGSVS